MFYDEIPKECLFYESNEKSEKQLQWLNTNFKIEKNTELSDIVKSIENSLKHSEYLKRLSK